ncbi:hypothetical protein F5Y19DRAFT_491212 [Xylariaceae sp. FL1651]|nr:hypothetical protein F5Y19DRAFT_491212 [Xylariaceae sp. FL1651]
MAESKARDMGDYFPFVQEMSPKIAPPPEPKTQPSTSGSARSVTPRGQRFNDLSEAYRNITSRQGLNNPPRKASDPPQSPPIISSPVVTASSLGTPIPSSNFIVGSQDDLQIRSPTSVAQNYSKKNRRASIGAIDFFGDLSPKMGRGNSKRLSLSNEIERELSKLKAQSQDTSGSTIEKILAQYDGRASGVASRHDTRDVRLSNEHTYFESIADNVQHRVNTDLSISKPPQSSLPAAPLTQARQASSVRLDEDDSPGPDSSIIDSQYLLDADAQVHELEDARRALVPLPLAVHSHRGVNIPKRQTYDAPMNKAPHSIYDGQDPRKNPFEHPDDEKYKIYLEPLKERDISRQLKRASHLGAFSAGTFYSPDVSPCGKVIGKTTHVDSDTESSPVSRARPQEKLLDQSSFPTNSDGETHVRNIKVVIGRKPETEGNGQKSHGAQADVKRSSAGVKKAGVVRDMLSDEGDWVTEATSDVGFGFDSGIVAREPLTGDFKRTGSSLADYSDDDHEDVLHRFGSSERIIQHPARDQQYTSCGVQRPKDSKLAVLLPRRTNAFPDNSNRQWPSTVRQESAQSVPKSANPFRQSSCKRPYSRLAFQFDKNAPSKYEFRDSLSEYELAAVSTKANCGTYPYGTNGSLPSPVPEAGEDNHPSTTDAHFDRSADFDADRNPSSRFSSAPYKPYETPRRGQDGPVHSIYAVDRRRQREEYQKKQFAAASSFEAPSSADSIRSKFDFELLPLGQAQQKNKRQRDTGETNETESTAARMKRKESIASSGPASSPLEPPAKAFFTGSDLSINFTPPNWRIYDPGQQDTPTPFGISHHIETTPSKKNRHRQDSGLGSPYTPSIDTPSSASRRLWYGHKEPSSQPSQRKHRHKPRPGFVAPDDYVSDRADGVRHCCFCFLAALSLLPFFAILVLTGVFSDALKWATRGEVYRLTAPQRRFIKWMLLVECVIYGGGLAAIVAYFVTKSKVSN